MQQYVLVVLHKTDDSFGYFDVHSGKQIELIKTQPFPHEICLSPDRKKIYIAEMGLRAIESKGPGGHTIAVYDTKTRELLSTIDTGHFDRPHGIVTHNSGRLFITSESTNYLLIYDLLSHTLRHTVYLDQEYAHMVNVTPDGKSAYTTNIGSNTITEVEVASGKVVRHIPTLERPEGLVFSKDGQLIYVVCRESRGTVVIDRQNGIMIDKIEMGHGTVRVVITPDGKRLVIPLFHSDAIQIVDTKKRKVTHTINVGKQPAGIAISRNGKLVFISCEEENAVYVFSMETIEVINIIKTGPGCDAMVCLDGNEI